MLVTLRLFPSGVAQDEAHEQRHGTGSRALLAPALPRGAGDVEVRPAHLAREAREERSRGDGAALAPADVGEIGEVRAQLLLVVLPQRELPHPVPGVVSGLPNLV